MEDAFPRYLSIGMSADEFWNQDGLLVKAYRKADEYRQQREDTLAWLQGRYIYDALGAVAPIFRDFVKGARVSPYVKSPYYEQFKERKKADKREIAKQNGINYMLKFTEMYNKQRAAKKAGEKDDRR